MVSGEQLGTAPDGATVDQRLANGLAINAVVLQQEKYESGVVGGMGGSK